MQTEADFDKRGSFLCPLTIQGV